MKFYVGDKRFISSTAALVLGIVSYASAVVNPTPGVVVADSLPAFYIILGTLAYRSAKKRKLKLVENTGKRKVLEFLALALIAMFIIFGPYVPQLIQNGDIITLVIFVWSVAEYFFGIPKNIVRQNKNNY